MTDPESSSRLSLGVKTSISFKPAELVSALTSSAVTDEGGIGANLSTSVTLFETFHNKTGFYLPDVINIS